MGITSIDWYWIFTSIFTIKAYTSVGKLILAGNLTQQLDMVLIDRKHDLYIYLSPTVLQFMYLIHSHRQFVVVKGCTIMCIHLQVSLAAPFPIHRSDATPTQPVIIAISIIKRSTVSEQRSYLTRSDIIIMWASTRVHSRRPVLAHRCRTHSLSGGPRPEVLAFGKPTKWRHG